VEVHEERDVAARLEAAGIPYERNGQSITTRDPWGNRIELVISS